MISKSWLVLLAISAASGCTVRGLDTTLVPQLYANGEVIYIYSDLANMYQPDADETAEKNRLRDLNDWITDAGICPSGYEIVKRQPVGMRSWSQGKKVYYFIKCKG